MDVTDKGVTGAEAQELLEQAGITVNKNSIPFDPLPPTKASGIRIGTPAVTTRHMGPEQMRLTVYFSRTLYDAARTLVTSLRAAPGSIIRVYGCDEQPASTGDLTIDADLGLAIATDTQDGYLAIKGIANNKFQRGPVVEGLIVAGDRGPERELNLTTLSSTQVRQLEADIARWQELPAPTRQR